MRGRVQLVLAVALILAPLLSVLQSARPAFAATIQVTTSADDAAVNGNCTLREAVQAANTNLAVDACPAGNGTDQITFAAATNGNTILLSNGQITISSGLQIVGNGVAQTRVDGQKGTGSATQVFIITGGTVGIDALTIQNGGNGPGGGAINVGGGSTLTLTNANLIGNTASNGGGIAVANGATLEASNSTFSQNTATSVGGGAIINLGGQATVTSSTFSNNSGSQGGAINNQGGGTFNLSNSTLSGNTAPSAFATGAGGGVAIANGAVNITNSTLSGNSASGVGAFGGGIASAGTLNITNSTLSGNSASGTNANGGGIWSSATANIVNSTLAGNSTSGTGSTADGIFLSAGTTNLRASILANAANGENCNPARPDLVSQGSNVLDDDTCFPGAATPTDQVVADARLGPLANNGGPTLTHALLDSSPALDAVQDACTVTTDQRGQPRPSGVRCDAGSFERQAGTLQFSSATFSGSEAAGNATITVTRTGGSDVAVSATLTPTNGTATAPADFNNTPIVVNFAAGQTTANVQVPIVNDTLIEGNETVNLALATPTGGASIGAPNAAVLTITDDEAAPGLSVSDVTVTEGGDGSSKLATFTVTLSPVSGQTVTVQAQTANDTATAGSDYVAKTETLTFAPGETTKTVRVTVNGDGAVEPDETFSVKLSNATNTTIADGQGTGTILNDDEYPSIDPNNNGQGDKKDKDEKDQETEDEQRQRERTNAGNRDDIHAEGTVVSVTPHPGGEGILVDIAFGRGGAERATVFIRCQPGQCPSPVAGDALEADGYWNDKRETGNTWFVASDSWEFSPKR